MKCAACSQDIECSCHPVLVQGAKVRDAVISAAGIAFAIERDKLHRRLVGQAFRDAIAPHEQAHDRAVAAAWRDFDAVRVSLGGARRETFLGVSL